MAKLEQKQEDMSNTMLSNHSAIIKQLGSLDAKMDRLNDEFVTKKEFSPIQKLVYGLVGTVLTAFVLALVYFVFKGTVPII